MLLLVLLRGLTKAHRDVNANDNADANAIAGAKANIELKRQLNLVENGSLRG